MKDDHAELDRLLQEWPVTSALPPRFRDRVWRSIEHAEVRPHSITDALSLWLEAAFARPAFAVVYVGVLLVMGLALGSVQASQHVSRWDQELETRYVQGLDPYQRSHR